LEPLAAPILNPPSANRANRMLAAKIGGMDLWRAYLAGLPVKA